MLSECVTTASAMSWLMLFFLPFHLSFLFPLLIGGSKGAPRASPKGPDSFVLTNKILYHCFFIQFSFCKSFSPIPSVHSSYFYVCFIADLSQLSDSLVSIVEKKGFLIGKICGNTEHEPMRNHGSRQHEINYWTLFNSFNLFNPSVWRM